ncbi:ParB N-terminal domain-containing protein [Streptomyces cirratus]
MSSKADKLGVSASFARAQPVGVSSRRAAIAEATGAPTSGIVPPSEVPIEALAHNPFNLREDLTELDELAQSLLSRGQLQPLAVATRMAFMEAHPGQTDGLGAPRTSSSTATGDSRPPSWPVSRPCTSTSTTHCPHPPPTSSNRR